MIEHIPERTIVTCDVCQVRCDKSIGFLRRQEGRLIIEQHALDFLGSPCANGNIKFDLCDSCLRGINKALNAAIDKIRNPQAEPTP